jgi:plasmid stabilization system protein ParE
MGVKVNLHSRAEQDLQDIKSYLVQHVVRKLRSACGYVYWARSAASRTPRAWEDRPPTPTFRILPPTHYPYRVYYAIARDFVIVLHIRHSARRDPDLTSL